MSKATHLLLSMLLLVFPATALAQQETINFRHLGVQEGLSLSKVYCIVQDSLGFTWIGTEYGLNRYDGYSVQRFKADGNPRTGLLHNSISGLYEDSSNRLWIGTFGRGINRLDLTTDHMTAFKYNPDNPKGPASGRVKDFIEDASGRLWVGTYNGLDLYNEPDNSFIHYQYDPNDPNSISASVVRDLHIDSQGRFWVGTTRGGLNRFYPDTGRFEHYRHNPNNPASINSDSIKRIFEDQQGRLWLGTNNGLALFNPESGTFTRYTANPEDPNALAHDRIYGIAGDDQDRLWIGTLGGGLHRFNPENGQFFRIQFDPSNPNGLSENRIRDVLINNGMLWVGTYAGVDLHPLINDGFKHYRHDPFDPQSLSANRIRAMHKDSSGDIWVGAYRGGINQLKRDGDRSKFVHYRHDPNNANSLSSDNIYDLLEDRNGDLWAATAAGLDRINTKTGGVTRFSHDPQNSQSLSQDRLRSLYEDSSGTLWVGSYNGGLNKKIGPDQFQHFKNDPKDPRSLISNRVRTIIEDSDQRILAGTFRGFNRLEPDGRFTRFLHDDHDPKSIIHDQIHAMAKDGMGRIWIATFGGLSRMEGDRFTNWTVSNGLPSDLIIGVVVDLHGDVWVSTGKGLSRLSRRSGVFRNYNMLDGLQNDEFAMGAYGIGADGELFFGGINGFNTFYPEHLRLDTHPPTMHLTNLLLQNRAVPLRQDPKQAGFLLDQPMHHTRELTFSYHESLITFEFAAIHYTDPTQNRYAYKMEGLDEDWIETDAANRRATYTGLPPGKYRFLVKGSNPEEVWSEEPAEVAVTVTPPPWQTWWAYTFYALAAMAVLLGFMYAQTRKLAREREANRRLDRMVQERTASLQRRHDELDGLDRIVRMINRQIALPQVLETILIQGLAMFEQADKGLFLLRDPAGDGYTVTAVFGFSDTNLDNHRFDQIDLYNPNHSNVHSVGRNVFLINPAPDNPTKCAAAIGVPRAMLIMTLELDTVIEGYLLFCNDNNPNAFDHTDTQRHDRFREHAVSALAKARLLAELQFKNDEILRAQDQLILQEKMSSMGLLTAGIAHELKNPLNFINNFSDIAIDLMEELSEALEADGDEDRQNVAEILSDLCTNVAKIGEHGRRANDVIMSMMNLAGGATSKPAPADLSRLIIEALDLARDGAACKLGDTQVDFTTQLEISVGSAPVHSGDLRRVLINLITNAIDALLIKKAATPSFQPCIHVHGKGDAHWVDITIQDNGPGISKDHQSRIFTPFFTTKTCDSGNVGLGLSLCYDIIVREHHGDLSVDSTPGSSTTFTIRLPRS